MEIGILDAVRKGWPPKLDDDILKTMMDSDHRQTIKIGCPCSTIQDPLHLIGKLYRAVVKDELRPVIVAISYITGGETFQRREFLKCHQRLSESRNVFFLDRFQSATSYEESRF
ncbi:hypothetical protein NPIL_665241 [Nephila pilipes]|uniref:Uncharacterized protein n=1 Tax=Nephila pilipes TaxID=299642 RepID=A0A8X6IJZ5_NEPPI|nr:hypothetical protein NPIL_665241 [Nephila pilipes]